MILIWPMKDYEKMRSLVELEIMPAMNMKSKHWEVECNIMWHKVGFRKGYKLKVGIRMDVHKLWNMHIKIGA